MSSPKSSDSSSEDEGEKERKRQLQEAVIGVSLPSASSGPPSKKPKLSKRAPNQQEDETGSGAVVSTDMQKFLAKKLTQFLDKQYDVVTYPNTSEHSIPPPTQAPLIRLLHSSRHPISLDPPTRKPETPAAMSSSDTDSCESEFEKHRLRDAAIDIKTLLDKR